MAWDVEGRRIRISQAAVDEFARHGLAGARIDRIAEAAAVSKERIYSYFGDKEQLFALVLSEQLADLARSVPLEATDGQSLGEYAGRAFDYHAANPHLLRLLHWEGLERGDEPIDVEGRTAYYRSKVRSIAAAQRRGSVRADVPAAQLLYAIIAMAAWSFAVPQIATMLTGADPTTRRAITQQRKAVVELATRLASVD
jgi:AcrR family transcriptional regulator